MRFIPPIIRFGLILLVAFLGLITLQEANASDMDCFNLESAQMQYKHSQGLKAKVKARKMINSLTLLCNQGK